MDKKILALKLLKNQQTRRIIIRLLKNRRVQRAIVKQISRRLTRS